MPITRELEIAIATLPLKKRQNLLAAINRNISDEYDQMAKALGLEFPKSVESTLLRIQHFASLYPAMWRAFRRAVTPQFPFGITYLPNGDAIRILAIYPVRSIPDNTSHLSTHRT